MDKGIETAASLLELISAYPSLRGKGVLQKLVGISERALKGCVSRNPAALLPVDQSLRARQLAEILERATQVMGARKAAEVWIGQQAIGLDGMVPLDVLALSNGFSILRDHLLRLEYGVYI